MRKSSFLVILLLALVTLGCEEKLEFKYQDKPQLVECPGVDKALIHEALYSFQEDIGVFYNKFTDHRYGTSTYYVEAYRQFVYFGFSGEANFAEIVSEHSLKVLKELKKIDGLWTSGNEDTNLNYDHEFVKCLFNNVEDEDMRQRLHSLIEVNYLSPQMVAEPMRVEVLKIIGDEHLAMYMMLDAYYQYLINFDFPEAR